MANMNFSYNITDDSIVVITLDTFETLNAHSTNPNFEAIKEALKNPDTTTDELIALMSPEKAIHNATVNYKNIEVLDGHLYYKGKQVHSTLADRIVSIVAEGLPVEPWAKFAENVYRNPAEYAREELYLWLSQSDLPITPDGHFLAYKRVREDYRDVHTGTFDNSIGATPSMKREDVDSDRSRTCSAGLHFCSKEYLRSFSGARVMIVKVNPEHVVSIPSDYNNAKGRACQYTVVGEVEEQILGTKVWPTICYDYPYDEDDYDDCDNDCDNDDYWNDDDDNIYTDGSWSISLADYDDNVNHYGSKKKWAKMTGIPYKKIKAASKYFFS